MTIIDIVIVLGALVAIRGLVNYRDTVIQLGIVKPVWIIVCGIIAVSAIYVADFYIMHVMPLLASKKAAMALMEKLHLNWNWLASLIGVSCMVLGLIFLLGRLFPQVVDRERAERSLRKSEANLSNAQRIAHLGSFEWDIGQDRLSWSDEIYRILKLDRESFEPSVERYMSLIHPDDRAAVQAETDAALAERRAYDITFRILCSDGEERIIHDQAEIEADETGRPLRMRGAFHDITERKRAEEEQKTLLNQLRHAQRIAKLDGWLWDKRSDEVHFFSHGDTVHGVPVERLQSLPLREYNDTYMHPEDRVRVEEAYARLPETKEAFELEYRVFDTAGDVRTIFEVGEAMFDEAGAYIGNFGILQDITEHRQAERELAEKTSLLDGLIENAQTVITIKDPEGRYIHVNREFEKFVGRTAEELKGKTPYDVFPRETAEAQDLLDRKAVESGGPIVVENELPRRDGVMRSYMNTKIPVFDPQGNLIAMGTMALDITERKTAEERFRRYFDLPLVGSAIYTPNKKWIQVNDKLCALLGYSRDELMQVTWADLTHPDDLAENARLFDEALAGERDSYSMDKRFIRKDGDILYTSISVHCLRKPNGDPDYFMVLVQDLTERRRAEEALLLTQECVDHAGEGVFWVNDKAEFSYVNETAGRSLGYSRDELLSMRMFDIDPDFHEGMWPEFWSEFERKGSMRFETRHQRKDGGVHPVEIVVNHFSSQDQIFMHAYVRDISEQKRAAAEILKLNEELEQRVAQRTAELRAAQEELVRQERLAALGQLTGTVSHELRNPLGAMRTAVAAIKKLTPGEDPLLRSSVSIVDRSITRCDNIIGDLLDYSRLRPLERESTDADDWLASLLDEYQLPSGVTLRRELASDARLTIDDDRLRRALINVIDNACQAMVGPGINSDGEREHILTVAATEAAGRCEIAIDDTGSGIARDDQKRIFEPLYSTKSFGVGLGLPLVKRVVEQHDGTIEVDSEPGTGTRFVIRLPLATAELASNL